MKSDKTIRIAAVGLLEYIKQITCQLLNGDFKFIDAVKYYISIHNSADAVTRDICQCDTTDYTNLIAELDNAISEYHDAIISYMGDHFNATPGVLNNLIKFYQATEVFLGEDGYNKTYDDPSKLSILDRYHIRSRMSRDAELGQIIHDISFDPKYYDMDLELRAEIQDTIKDINCLAANDVGYCQNLLTEYKNSVKE